MFPDVMSLTNEEPLAYSTGFTHPMDPLPAAKRAALMFENIPAATGHDAEVPAAIVVIPFGYLGSVVRTRKSFAANDRSGYPLLLVLYPGRGICPDASLAAMYELTLERCQSSRA